MTPTAAIREAGARLAAAGVASPDHDAEALAAWVLGVNRAGLVTQSGWPADTRDRYETLVARRAEREPLQHLTGVAYFRHLELAVGPGVFVPRPETEMLVDLVLPAVQPGVVVVDLCAGSGAVGLALATERPGAVVHLVEADAVAAEWLERNVARAEAPVTPVVHRVTVRDALAVLPNAVDVVVSNPPYLPAGLSVEPEVGHDPATALWGGEDGLDTVREVVNAAAQVLAPGGVVAIEHDVTHQNDVLALLAIAGFVRVRGHLDLAGRPRFATAHAPVGTR